MLRKLKRAKSLSINDWLSFIQAWAMFLIVDLWLRVGSFNHLQSILGSQTSHPTSKDTSADQLTEEEIGHLGWIAEAAGRNHIIEMSCLRRALVQQWLLRKHGVRTELRFGVRMVDGTLQAHAWLEKNGKLVTEPEVVRERYATLLEMGEASLEQEKSE